MRSITSSPLFYLLGPAVVLTCQGFYEGAQFKGTLKFMRVWLKENGYWRIIAGSTIK